MSNASFDPTVNRTGQGVPENTGRGIAEPKKEQLNVYMVMLIIAFLAISIACAFLLLEFSRYDFQMKPAVAAATTSVPAVVDSRQRDRREYL